MERNLKNRLDTIWYGVAKVNSFRINFTWSGLVADESRSRVMTSRLAVSENVHRERVRFSHRATKNLSVDRLMRHGLRTFGY